MGSDSLKKQDVAVRPIRLDMKPPFKDIAEDRAAAMADVKPTAGPLKVVRGPQGEHDKGRVIVAAGGGRTRHIATVFGPDHNADANADEIVRRWNAHDQMLQACEYALARLLHGSGQVNPNDSLIDTMQAAIKAGSK